MCGPCADYHERGSRPEGWDKIEADEEPDTRNTAERLHEAVGYPEPCLTLHGFLVEALEYEREAFEEDTDVSGADLCEWFSGWRARVHAELVALQVYGPDTEKASPRVPISPPGSTLAELENDRAALAALVQLADSGGLAGSLDAQEARRVAAIAWAKERLQETENSIEARTGGMPDPYVLVPLETVKFAALTLIDLDDLGTFYDDHDNGDAVRLCIRTLAAAAERAS
jgi:hypothetical protein